jgi:hypothetical protein
MALERERHDMVVYGLLAAEADQPSVNARNTGS